MQRPRVFLADDHTLLLEAFSTLLAPKCEIVGTAVDGREMLKEVRKLKPDVVVLDINMPNLNGFDAGEKLKKLFPDIKLLFLTVNEDPELVTEAFRIGANGYLLKNSAASELFQAIDVVMSGNRYVTPGVARDMNHSFTNNQKGESVHARLTLRQREVLQLIAEGKTMKEIAGILNITPRTVAFHKYQMMEELDIHNNSELIQYAIKHGYVT